MIATELRLPELGLVAGTRGLLGAGIGLRHRRVRLPEDLLNLVQGPPAVDQE